MIVKLVAKNKSYTNKDRPLKLSSFGVVKFIYLSVAILIETVLILVFYLLLKMSNEHKELILLTLALPINRTMVPNV